MTETQRHAWSIIKNKHFFIFRTEYFLFCSQIGFVASKPKGYFK